MMADKSGNPIARVYDSSTGEHVANLHTDETLDEFRESGAYRVEEVR